MDYKEIIEAFHKEKNILKKCDLIYDLLELRHPTKEKMQALRELAKSLGDLDTVDVNILKTFLVATKHFREEISDIRVPILKAYIRNIPLRNEED